MKIQACVFSILDWWGRSLIGMGHCISKKSITQCKDCIKTREHYFQQSKYHSFFLVGGLEYEFYDFPYLSIIYGIIIIPADSYFSEGKGSTNNQSLFFFHFKICRFGAPKNLEKSHGDPGKPRMGDVLVSGHSPRRRSVLDPVEFGHFFLFGREKMKSWCIFEADNHNFRIQFAPHEQFELQ